MAMINIGETDDPAYRYKMPRLMAKIEGRGNGIKTVIVNCVAISKALRRPPEQVCKFFGAHLGAQTKFIAPKKDVDAKAIVNGAFETGMLQDCLQQEYIPRFVLCPECGLPETDLSVVGNKKSGFKVMHTCQACGHVGEADAKHKLCTFIIKDAMATKLEEDKSKKKKPQSIDSAGLSKIKGIQHQSCRRVQFAKQKVMAAAWSAKRRSRSACRDTTCPYAWVEIRRGREPLWCQ